MYPVLSLRWPRPALKVSPLAALPCCVSVCLDATAVNRLNHRGYREQVGFTDVIEAGKISERKVFCRLLVNAVLGLADLQRPVQDAAGLNGGGGLLHFR